MLSRVSKLGHRVSESAAAFRSIARNPNLRRLQIAWVFAISGHWAYIVAVSVYTYQASGTAAVGLVLALRLFLAALVAPVVGVLGDRYRRERLLLVSTVIRTVLMGSAALCVLLDAPPVAVYVLAILAAIATSPYRSSQAALLPKLAESPEELTAGNAVVSTVESIAMFLGPALAGLLLALTSAGPVFAINAAMLAIASLFIARIYVAPATDDTGTEKTERPPFFSQLLAGFTVIGRDRPLLVLITLLTAQTLVLGAVEVYIVVVAFQLVGKGAGAVGLMNSASGVGAILGGLLMLSFAGRRRFSAPFAAGVTLLGAPLIVLGVWPSFASALLMFGILGFGSSVLDVSGITLVQRVVPDEVLARVFGVIQMLWYLSLALGAALAPALLAWLGTQASLIVTGAFLVALVALLWPALTRIDATTVAPDSAVLEALAAIPMFAMLAGPALELIAGRLTPLRVDGGATVIREGDEGDRFYIVAEGTLEVSQGGEQISELSSGDYFGEIALIRDVPRTATVTAQTPAFLYGLEREHFLAAVMENPPSAHAAETIVNTRLGDPLGRVAADLS